MEKKETGPGKRKLNRLQEFALAKKMESLKAHIFEDKPTIAAFTKTVSEDLGFSVSRRTVSGYFKILWPDKKWPGKRQSKPRAGGTTVYLKLKNHDQLINALVDVVDKLLAELNVESLRLELLNALKQIEHEQLNNDKKSNT